MTFRATLAYDGTAYQGFQRQAGDTPTIQLALERAIAAVTGQSVTVNGAGRTDSGVHAAGQVIAFNVDWSHSPHDLLRAVNAHLPDDIALQDIRWQDGFHPRYDALARCYRYTVVQAGQRQPLWRDFAWWVRQPLDMARMQQAADLLRGRHDFAAFGHPPQGENTVRELFRSRWTQVAEPFGMRLVYEVEGTAFLHHMVRRMVGLQVEVGRGAVDLQTFAQVFHSADLSLVKVIAPPQGLVLWRVRYPDDPSEAGGDPG